MTIASAKIEAWGLFLAVSRAASAAVEQDLRKAGLPSVAAYEALLTLARAESGMRANRLGEALMMPQYGLSRLVDRMEKSGLVRRMPCPEDARGQIVAVTVDGLEMLDRMWPVYRDAIAARFADRFSEEEALFLSEILRRFAPEGAAVGP